MSYFMTISGDIHAEILPPLELLPISSGQKYIADLEAELSVADGTPLWFVNDGRTGTSHDFVSDAQDHYNEHGTIEGTVLLSLMKTCVAADCVFRIWWASNDPSCYRKLTEFTSLQELCSGIGRMLSDGLDISAKRRRVAIRESVRPESQ